MPRKPLADDPETWKEAGWGDWTLPAETPKPPPKLKPAPKPTIVPRTIVPPEPKVAPRTRVEVAPESYTRVPNDIFDKVLPELGPYEQSILLRLYRLTWGWHKDTCTVGYGTLAKACKMSIKKAQLSIASLIEKKLIERVGKENAGQKRSKRGTVYRINLPAATIAPRTMAPRTIVRDADNKERVLNKQVKEDVRCAKCETTGGFIYMEDRSVRKCNHD
jgi:hypothetical protein